MTTSESGDVLEWSQFSPLDYGVFVCMLVLSAGIGIYSALKSRGHESTQNFLLGGRNMSPIPVVFSTLGGLISSVSLLGNPTEVYFHGTQVVTNQIGKFIGFILIYQLILPIFYKLEIVSVSQYLVLRYKSSLVQKIASLCLIGYNILAMGVILYGPALTLATATGLTPTASILLMGAVCTFYITVGGVKAVIYTDVLQTLILFGGVLVVVIICCVDIGGVGTVWHIAEQGERIEFFDMDPSLFVRHTFWSTVVYGFVSVLSMTAFNQNLYQRFASVNTLVKSQRVSVCFIIGQCVIAGICYFSGLVAYAAYYKCDPLTSGRIQKPDQILPYLVMNKLGQLKGVAGLFVAAIYGAVLSSVSSAGNSIACIMWEDFLKDSPYFSKMSTKSATNILKLISACAGMCGIFFAFLVQHLDGLLIVLYKIVGAVLFPLSGVHMAGLITPWVNAKGAVVGFITALTFNLWTVVGSFIIGVKNKTFLPLSTDGCPENLINDTTHQFITTETVDILLTTPPSADSTTDSHNVYDISYCYTTAFGFLIVLVVSNLVSICTGCMPVGAASERLSCSLSVRLYQWMSRKKYRQTPSEEHEVEHFKPSAGK